MPLSAAALEPLLRLALVSGIGPARLALLVERFGDADRALGASRRELASLPGVGVGLAERVLRAGAAASRQSARAALLAMERVGAVALTPADAEYPASFHQVADPPYLLFACGDLNHLRRPGVAVVGTRAPSEYGATTAATLAADLCRAGYAIISGMAKGIDARAHAAALDVGGATVGVLGNGIDRVYPADNRALFARMREHGLLLSEFMPGEQPAAGNFPRRNRLIAALSAGVLVVEMGTRSGAQHTVSYALDQGREVFAVPGPIGASASTGTNQLLKEGARLVTSAADVVEELRGVGAAAQPPAAPLALADEAPVPPPTARPAPPPDLAPEQRRVWDELRDEPRHVDDIAAAAGLPAREVLGALLGLELAGVARALPGQQYQRA